MKKAKLKILEQSDNVGLYSICFNENDLTEYELFIQKFLNDATLNRDFQKIFRAINRIMANGALERYFRTEGKLKDKIWRHFRLILKFCVCIVCEYRIKY